METPKTVEESGNVYEVVSKAKQKEAVDFLNKNLFATPVWLVNQEIYNKVGGINGLTVIGSIQDRVLSRLLSAFTLNKLSNGEAELGNNAYQITELLNDLKKGVWSELSTRKPVDVYRRNLQKSFVNTLTSLINPPKVQAASGGATVTVSSSNDKSDVISVVRGFLSSLRIEANAAAATSTDAMTKYHLQDVSRRIDNALNPKN